ncbi:MAG: Gfo/Idh/MocA family oxidoreductase [Candidatus Pacebacteria bacterium]|nr:Gfo/Idh/MocA family oxidoreductase [Candidatus Paceibacterota bacterium]
MKSVLIVGSGNYGAFIDSALCPNFKTRVIDGFDFNPENVVENFVSVATPHFTHYDIVKKLIQNGKNVLCEKPLSLSLDEIVHLQDLAQEYNCSLNVGLIFQNHPFYIYIKELQNNYGPIKRMEVRNRACEHGIESDWYWDKAKSGGWFLTSEIHWYHLFLWITEPKTILVSEASESIEQGRTTHTWSVARTDIGQSISIDHTLNSLQDEIGCEVDIFFDTVRITIKGWIPESIESSDLSSLQNLNQKIGNRDDEYRKLIHKNMENLFDNVPSNFDLIIQSHTLAVDAQRMSDLNTQNLTPRN